MEEQNEGSYLLGGLLGFFLPCLGLIVGIALPGSKTTVGAISGFVANLLLSFCFLGIFLGARETIEGVIGF